MKLYQVIGRKAPTQNEKTPPAYRMVLAAKNESVARSRFWYFMHQMRKMKKTTGQILDVNELVEKNPRVIKNYGIWIRYNSRSGTHNMYKEFRDLTLVGAIQQLYQEMAGRHRSRTHSIQIIRTAIIPAKKCRRTHITQFHNPKIRFPLPHRRPRAEKSSRSTFVANRPTTCLR